MLESAASPFFSIYSLFFLSEVAVVLLFFVLRTGITTLFLSVGGPCEALQRKYLLCYSGHFFGGILLETYF